MLVSAAVLPHPPGLVPEVAAGAANELEAVRVACAAALHKVLAADVDLVVVVGSGSEMTSFASGAAGSLAGLGVPVQAALPGAPPERVATLPTSLAVGAWLMQRHEGWPPLRAEALPTTVTPKDAAALGQRWAAAAERVAIIAMGDGSAGLTLKAPGYLVDGAQLWQKQITQALADVELEVIRDIEPADAAKFVAAGRPAWQALAGAAETASTARGRWRGELLADESPYGVAYVVATWTWEPA